MSNTEALPLVSICCLTYNHAPFIRQCLDGFLMQKTTFPFEILIHDDASTDGTDDIVREYASKYPDIIFPLYEDVNKYTTGYSGQMDLFNYKRARGKYIAYCEGDDYWIDPLKLQKQVDFLDTHPDFSVCFTRYKKLIGGTEYAEDMCGELIKNNPDGVEITVDLYLKHWVTQGLTMMFRKSSYNYEWSSTTTYYRDFFEYYFLLKNGRGWLFPFVSGVYRISGAGVYTMLDNFHSRETDVALNLELWHISKDNKVKCKYLHSIQYLIDVCSKDSNQKLKLLHYALAHFYHSRNVKSFMKNIIHIIKG